MSETRPVFHAVPHPKPDGPLGWRDPKLRSLCGLDPEETERFSTVQSGVTCSDCRAHDDFRLMPENEIGSGT